MLNNMIVGNWKMNGLGADLEKLDIMSLEFLNQTAEVVICPPATLVREAIDICRGSQVKIGGQDCHTEVLGAHTGDISASMLADAGVTHVIVGHSERRAAYNESNVLARTKTIAAQKAGLMPILCIGETQEEKRAGKTREVLRSQIEEGVPTASTRETITIAYEPVWAIGTGNSARCEDVKELHGFICAELRRILGEAAGEIRVLYGGSVNANNAADLAKLPGVSGFLVGGASLKVADFSTIVEGFG